MRRMAYHFLRQNISTPRKRRPVTRNAGRSGWERPELNEEVDGTERWLVVVEEGAEEGNGRVVVFDMSVVGYQLSIRYWRDN